MSDYERIAGVIRYLDGNFVEQPDLATLAARAGMSESHFHHLFTDWVGATPKEFLQCLTVARARQLLLQGESVLGAAHEAGLSGPGDCTTSAYPSRQLPPVRSNPVERVGRSRLVMPPHPSVRHSSRRILAESVGFPSPTRSPEHGRKWRPSGLARNGCARMGTPSKSLIESFSQQRAAFRSAPMCEAAIFRSRYGVHCCAFRLAHW